MFTGIVEEVGRVSEIKGDSRSSRIFIEANFVLQDVKLGDSIAVNGICLTVTSFTPKGFTADVMPETMNRTNLGSLSRGSIVNLERAMRMGDRFGGHIVSGHVDGTGILKSKEAHANATLVTVQCLPHLLRYMIPRGSITMDGISLTIIDVMQDGFTVSIIPHTSGHTTLTEKKPGELINLECDMIGKYVERLLQRDNSQTNTDRKSSLNYSFLQENGFL